MRVLAFNLSYRELCVCVCTCDLMMCLILVSPIPETPWALHPPASSSLGLHLQQFWAEYRHGIWSEATPWHHLVQELGDRPSELSNSSSPQCFGFRDPSPNLGFKSRVRPKTAKEGTTGIVRAFFLSNGTQAWYKARGAAGNCACHGPSHPLEGCDQRGW